MKYFVFAIDDGTIYDKKVLDIMKFVIQKEKEKESHNQETLYFAAEFLKRYDTTWYNQNVKDWIIEKEKYLK